MTQPRTSLLAAMMERIEDVEQRGRGPGEKRKIRGGAEGREKAEKAL